MTRHRHLAATLPQLSAALYPGREHPGFWTPMELWQVALSSDYISACFPLAFAGHPEDFAGFTPLFELLCCGLDESHVSHGRNSYQL